jgi:hypothetical protein
MRPNLRKAPKLAACRSLHSGYVLVELVCCALFVFDTDGSHDVRRQFPRLIVAPSDQGHHLLPLAFDARSKGSKDVTKPAVVNQFEDVREIAADVSSAAKRIYAQFEQHVLSSLQLRSVLTIYLDGTLPIINRRF